MTFKGMLKILISDYRKQHEEKMFSIVDELMKTRRELREVREQLRSLQSQNPPSHSFDSDSSSASTSSTISLFVQYYGFFNQLCDIRQTISIEELLVQLRQLAGIPTDRPLHLRVLSEDGSATVFYLHHDLKRTLDSYEDFLKPRMILSIEDCEENQSEPTTTTNQHSFSFDQTDV